MDLKSEMPDNAREPAEAAALSALPDLATEDTFLNAYTRRRAGARYDRELLSFYCGGETYAVDILQMREIIKLREITEVPRVPEFVTGILTVRGEVVTVIDLRKRLGLAADEITRHSRILICQLDGELVGLLVDGLRSVVRLLNDQIETTPTMGGVEEAYLGGIGRLGEELLILLDLDAVVTFNLEVNEGAR